MGQAQGRNDGWVDYAEQGRDGKVFWIITGARGYLLLTAQMGWAGDRKDLFNPSATPRGATIHVPASPVRGAQAYHSEIICYSFQGTEMDLKSCCDPAGLPGPTP